jgi:hypothetical protein
MRLSEMKKARSRMSSSEMTTGRAVRFFRGLAAAARGLRDAEALAGDVPTRRAVDLALGGAELVASGMVDAAGAGPVERLAGAAASLDFFELFTIYFCFRSAKPLPTTGRSGKRKRCFRDHHF